MYGWVEQHFIYCLRDPSTGEIGYVGYTCDPRTRYHDHMRRAHNLKDEKDLWIMLLREGGIDVVFEIIEVTSESMWEARERHWIESLRSCGEPLTNESPGGRRPQRGRR